MKNVEYIEIVFLVPSLAVTVRRLHDTGKSGWWLLIHLIPVVGWVIFWIWMFTDSQLGPNQWGDNPKGNNNNAPMTPADTQR